MAGRLTGGPEMVTVTGCLGLKVDSNGEAGREAGKGRERKANGNWNWQNKIFIFIFIC